MSTPLIKKIYTLWGGLCFLILATSIYWQVGRPYNPSTLPMYSGLGIYLTDIFIVLLLLFTIYLSFTAQKTKANLKSKFPSWFVIPFALLLGWSLLAVFFAISKEVAFYYLARWLLASLFGISILLLDVNPTTWIKWFIIGLCIHSFIALLQFTTNTPLHIPGELALEIEQPRAAVVSILGNQHLRAYGLTFHPNVLGGFLVIAIILTIPLIQRVSRLWALTLPVLLSGLVVSFSRSAWLALTIILVLFGLYAFSSKPSPQVKKSILTGFVVVILAGAAGGIFTNRLNLRSLAEFTSLFGRGELIQIALAAIRDHPIFGIGPGNFPLFMLQFRTLDPPHFVHNVPLLIASEVGILGGIIWYWLWIKPLTFLRGSFSNSDPLVVSLICAWMGICIIGLFDSYPWNLESGRLLSVSLLALIAKTNNQSTE